VGWIPSEWEALHLKSLCPEKAGIKTGPFGSQLHASDYVESGIPVIMPTNMSNGRVEKKNIAMVSENTARQLKSQSCKNGDILFARRGELGRCALIKETEDGYLNGTGCLRVRLQITKAYPSFMVEYFSTSYIKNWLERNAVGQTMLNLNTEILSTIPVTVPSLPEQKKIAEILSTWDAAIEQTRKLIDVKKRRKKALMQQLLAGRIRFSKFGKPSLETDGIPNGWQMVKLQNFATPVKRKNIKDIDKVLTASGELGLIDQNTFFNRSVAGQSLKDYYLLKKGEFAYNRSSMKNYPYGAIKRLDRYGEGILSTLYICFSITSDCGNSDYFMHLFESGLLNRGLRRVAQVGGRAHGLLNVTLKDFFSIKVPQPSYEEQSRIAEILSIADNEIIRLEKKLKAFEKQKHGLMQKLLTGEVRVKQ
jgi:type I restriction enzyme S subunit